MAVRSSRGLLQRIRRNSSGDAIAVEAEFLGTSQVAPGSPGGPSGAKTAPPFIASFERDRLGFELERVLPGGVRARWRRDSLGRPVHHEISVGATVSSARSYEWGYDQRLKRMIDALRGPVELSHDGLGQLAAVRRVDGTATLRFPDAVGNLFRTPERTDRRYGPAGELLEATDARGVTRYEYDPEGNLAKKLEPDGSTWLYEWNRAGMLAKVVRPDGAEVTFLYDPIGRRIAKTYRGRTTRWIWDGNVPLHEWVEVAAGAALEQTQQPAQTVAYDGEKALEALLAGRPAIGPPPTPTPPEARAASCGTAAAPLTWLFEPETFAPLAKLVDGEAFGIVADHLGAPLRMFDGAGSEVWAGELDAYGVLEDERGARGACPFRFPGQYADEETGLCYNRFRYYDPDSGQYISQDPIRIQGGLSAYGYAADPFAEADPFGLIGNKQLGDTAEEATSSFLKQNGYEVLGPMQNNSGHGIDLVVRDPGGNLQVVEVKANSSRLSAAQREGAEDFARSRAARAAGGAGHWAHPKEGAVKLAKLIREETEAGRRVRGLLARVEIDPSTGQVRSIVLSIWKCA